MIKKSRPQYLVSTDSIGLLGKPEQFIKLWKEYFDDKTLTGVEIIAFKPLFKIKKIISVFKRNNIPVLSFHGKTGENDWHNFLLMTTIMTLINSYIIDVEALLKYFPEIEFLSHGPYFENNSTKQKIYQQCPKKIWIENHSSGKRGINDVIKQIIIYRKNNINAVGMLDIFHYAVNSIKTLEKNWLNIVKELELYLLLKDKNGRQFFDGIHFPIGSRSGDSLPIDSMNDQMLELFAQKIIPHVERIVFENQQNFPGLLFSTDKMLEKQKIRNKRIIERLKKTGIIK